MKSTYDILKQRISTRTKAMVQLASFIVSDIQRTKIVLPKALTRNITADNAMAVEELIVEFDTKLKDILG